MAIRIFAYHQQVDWLFFVAFATVAVGIVIYSASGSSSGSPVPETVAAEEVVYKRVDTTTDEHEKSKEEAELGSSSAASKGVPTAIATEV